MTEESQIPEPRESGSDGQQVESKDQECIVLSAPLAELTMAKTVQGLAATNSRSFGGVIPAALLATMIHKAEEELCYTKQRNDELLKETIGLRERLAQSTGREAVLKERLSNFQTFRHISNFGIVIGTTLLGVGFELLKNNYQEYGIAALVAGSLLILVGWFSVPKGDRS